MAQFVVGFARIPFSQDFWRNPLRHLLMKRSLPEQFRRIPWGHSSFVKIDFCSDTLTTLWLFLRKVAALFHPKRQDTAPLFGSGLSVVCSADSAVSHHGAAGWLDQLVQLGRKATGCVFSRILTMKGSRAQISTPCVPSTTHPSARDQPPVISAPVF